MKFDDILTILGEFGPFQRRVYLIVCIIIFTDAWMSMITVFIGAPVDHWCAVEEWESYNCSGLSPDDCDIAKKNASIPSETDSSGELVYEQCTKYNVSGMEFQPGLDPKNYNNTVATIPCDQGWVYDTSQYESTAVTDFDLVCDQEDLSEVTQMVFYGGYLMGSIIFGFLSDWIGRWWTLFISMWLRLASGILIAFSPQYWVYTLLRFFQGMASISAYIICFIIGTEYVGPSKRNITGLFFLFPYACGYMLLALLAWLLPAWRDLQLVVALPVALFIPLLFLMPESARWLLAEGDYIKAEKIVLDIGKVNKKTAPDPVFTEDFKKEQDAIREEAKPNVFDLFRTSSVRIRTINLIFNWMVQTMVYHGLSLNTSNLGVNDYVAFAISGAIEIPASLINIFTVEYFGRKPSMCSFLLLAGVACLCTAAVPPGAWLTTVAMIGKFGVAGSFAVLYLYTAELYPTNIRTVAVGTCSMFARVANMLAPLILTLDKYWAPMPLVIFGAAAVVAGLLGLFLPETRGMQLPDTRREGEDYGKDILQGDGHGDQLELTGDVTKGHDVDHLQHSGDVTDGSDVYEKDANGGLTDDTSIPYVNPAYETKE